MLEQKSGHWQHFAAQSTPGAGFDVDFATVNGGGPSLLKRMIRDAIMRYRGSDPARHSKAFTHLWSDGPVSAQSVTRVGGTPIAFLAGHFVNTVLTYAPKHLFDSETIFLEIGAGSGYLMHFLLQQNVLSRGIIIDLPEVLVQGRKNLERLGTANRVTFLTPDQSESIGRFNVAVNTASMQEMLPETVSAYFDLLRRKAAAHRSVFYCCNRIEKLLSTKAGSSDTAGTPQDIPVRFSEYPWGCELVLLDRRSVIHDTLGMQPCMERMIAF